ncbi:MAG: NUDIX domain-containing protein [Acetobacteraceae bacterium]|nr:NUDIX domain-containing protein [Acetobacteraceae bacterium]
METPKIPVAPRPAATILLLRDGAAGLEVLMVCRAREVDFASGALVFPGGRVEAEDATLAGTDDPMDAFRVAAIREAWEECGLLLARAGIPRAGEGPFARHLAGAGTVPDTGALVRFAHWITPEHSPKRFDAHFFLAPAPAGQEAIHDGREAVETVWIRPAEAVAAADAGRRRLVFATRLNLIRLSGFGSTAEALAAEHPLVTVVPRPEPDGQGGTRLRVPAAAGYGADVFPAFDRPAADGLWPGQAKLS